MGSGGEVEERRLATVGIAHQSHADFLALGLFCLFGTRFGSLHFYHLGFLTAQTDLIAHDLVFHRVLQRGTQQHLHFLAFDEAHFHNTLAETAVSLYFDDIGPVACLQFREFHSFFLFACKGSK